MKSWIPTLIALQLAAIGCGGNDAEIAAELRRAERRANSKPAAEIEASYATTWNGKENATIQKGVHIIGSIYPGLTVAVETAQGVLLFDTTYEEDGRDLNDALLERGVPVKNISEIFITHAHFERLWGINSLREEAEFSVNVGKADCAAIRDYDMDKLHVLDADTEYRSGAIVIDRELEGGERFDFGDTTVEVIGTPGHTPGSVCYLVTKDGKRTLIAGDTIGSLKYGPEIFPVLLSPEYGGDAGLFLETIEKLMEMEPPDFLITGRPSLMSYKQPITFEGDWPEFLRPARDRLQRIAERQQRDGRDSLDQQAKVLEDGLLYLGTLTSIGIYAIQTDDELVVVNAPGGQACSTFVAERLKQLGIEKTHPDAIWLTSMDPETISGLSSFDPKPNVVAPEGGRRELAKMQVARPTLIGEETNDSLLSSGPEIKATPLADRQYDGVVYSLNLAGKKVLLTPPIPRTVSYYRKDLKTGVERREEVFVPVRQLSASIWEKDHRDSYADSLQQLANESPDIWLPAMPTATQSANLYDDDWETILEDNRRVIDDMRKRREGVL